MPSFIFDNSRQPDWHIFSIMRKKGIGYNGISCAPLPKTTKQIKSSRRNELKTFFFSARKRKKIIRKNANVAWLRPIFFGSLRAYWMGFWLQKLVDDIHLRFEAKNSVIFIEQNCSSNYSKAKIHLGTFIWIDVWSI